MKLQDNTQPVNVLVYDLETLKCYFLAEFYNPDTEEWFEFEISEYKNQIFELMKFYQDHPIDYLVGYNNLNFDMQVLEFIKEYYELWTDLDMSNVHIAHTIYKFAQHVIECQNYEHPLPYNERQATVKQIDVFRIHHFDNEAKRTSLKSCQVSMDWSNVEEMPIEHDIEKVTVEEIEDIKSYCRNDVLSTSGVLNLTLGISDNEFYKDENKIGDRFMIQEEEGLPCLNWNDVKIGEESNLKDYLALTNKTYADVKPLKVKQFFGMKYKHFFPNTVEFKTEKVRNFVEKIGNTTIRPEKQEFVIELGGNIITVARGGLHSSEGPRVIKSNDQFIYYQSDIGSQYPNAYLKYGLYPEHLGPEANTMVRAKIKKRLDNKALYKKTKDPKYNSLQKLGKLSLNGGLYGKLNQKGSFLESPISQLKITIGCQLEILMIVEALVEAGFVVTSANTDGFDTYVDRKREKEFLELCSYYEHKIGNSEMGQIEHTIYKEMWQMNVNHYMAVPFEGKPKKKGPFAYDLELHKDNSERIVAMALEQYIINGIRPEDYIPKHTNIYHFCAREKANKGCNLYLVYPDGKIENKKRLVRYYITTDPNAPELFKRGTGTKDNIINTNTNAPNELGVRRVCYFNRYFDSNDYKIDYNHYILKVYKMIALMEKNRKDKDFVRKIHNVFGPDLFG